MATYTSHYNLKKPATSDKIRIADFNGNADTIDSTMYDNASLIANLKSDIGIVENTNTASHNISVGQYVIWKGVLYTASSAISSGATLSNANLTAVSGGGLNALNSKITPVKETPESTSISPATGVTIHALDTIQDANLLYITVQLSVSSDISHGGKIFALAGYGYPKINNLPISLLADNANHISHVRATQTGTASMEIQSNGTTTAGNYYSGTIIVTLN